MNELVAFSNLHKVTAKKRRKKNSSTATEKKEYNIKRATQQKKIIHRSQQLPLFSLSIYFACVNWIKFFCLFDSEYPVSKFSRYFSSDSSAIFFDHFMNWMYQFNHCNLCIVFFCCCLCSVQEENRRRQSIVVKAKRHTIERTQKKIKSSKKKKDKTIKFSKDQKGICKRRHRNDKELSELKHFFSL